MTCIAAVVQDGIVYMGGDSAATDEEFGQLHSAEPKVFIRENIIFGISGNIREEQLLKYKLEIPRFDEGMDPLEWMVLTFVESLRECFREGGRNRAKDGVENFESQYLIGFNGRLFEVYKDYDVFENKENYATAGCAERIALGSLFSTKDMEPHRRVKTALEAASRYDAAVRPPFKILELE